MKRFITYLDDLAKRTYFGTDGTEPQRSGVLGTSSMALKASSDSSAS